MRYYESRAFHLSPRLVRSAVFTLRNLAREGLCAAAAAGRIRRRLRAMDDFGRAEIEAYQDARIRQVVGFAAETVPYYRDLFRRSGIEARDIRSARDLSRIPLLDKATVRQEGRRLRAERPSLVVAKAHTSGSTGSPLTVLRDLESICWEAERLRRWRRRAGVRAGEPRVVIRGDLFVRRGGEATKPWLLDPLSNLLLVSSYHLDPATLPAIAARIRAFSPVAIEGYPGALFLLAEHLIRSGTPLPVRAVLTSSEQVREDQRQAMQQAFSAEVFDQYGMAERAALASECRSHRMHVDMECSVLEVLRPDGRACLPGETGEVVGTSLTNLAMPLLRYRTGDLATLGDGPCPCGMDRPFLAELLGREADLVADRDGRLLSPAALTFPFATVTGVAESQLVNCGPGCLQVRVVPVPGFAEADLAEAQTRIVRGLKERLGPGFSIDFKVVPAIAKGPNGKHRFIVSNHRPNAG